MEEKAETIDAVQIWSVGADGIDNGGLDRVKREGSVSTQMDDIRFIIPIE